MNCFSYNAKMGFDKIFDLTAEVCFYFYNIYQVRA